MREETPEGEAVRIIGAGSRPDAAEPRLNAVFTVPNVITVVRFLGVPLFVWLILGQHRYGWGVVVLVLIGCTDWVDGYVARRFNQTSKLGRVLDPMADRLAMIVVAVTLLLAGIVPWWLLATLVVPDAVLLAVTLVFFHWHPDLPVSNIGKIRTALILAGTPLLLLAHTVGSTPNALSVIAWILLLAGIIGHVIAAVNYFRAMVAKHRRQQALGHQAGGGARG